MLPATPEEANLLLAVNLSSPYEQHICGATQAALLLMSALCRRQQHQGPQLLAGSGGSRGGPRGPPLTGGGGNRDGDWHQGGPQHEGPDSWSLNASASLHWQGWEDRVRADASFRDKVLIEQASAGPQALQL